MQNQYRIEKLTKEIWAMEDIKVHYAKAIADLSFEEFSVFVLRMQKRGDKYEGYTAEQYYLLLTRDQLRDISWKLSLKLFKKKKIRFHTLRESEGPMSF